MEITIKKGWGPILANFNNKMEYIKWKLQLKKVGDQKRRCLKVL